MLKHISVKRLRGQSSACSGWGGRNEGTILYLHFCGIRGRGDQRSEVTRVQRSQGEPPSTLLRCSFNSSARPRRHCLPGSKHAKHRSFMNATSPRTLIGLLTAQNSNGEAAPAANNSAVKENSPICRTDTFELPGMNRTVV